MKDLFEHITDGGTCKRGDRITVVRPIFNKAGIQTASVGYTGIILTDHIILPETLRIKIDGMHYPINYAKPHCVALTPNQQ